ncbi:hypothetical protein KJ365_04610 [Glaciecola sp. XM2]|jgi:hypothetical protein|uniref:hypothetical protein n=1 Tax=Glaciecola sp. XM2 TaxID=1914931 RepID=UPI001BDEE34B|nr:hypothetical protein [Glaciecola sp. XM2]MBT1450152.1 hypothetical protein [Glaciecola sp. XM2]
MNVFSKLSFITIVSALLYSSFTTAAIVEYDNDKSGFDAAIASMDTTVIDFESTALGTSITNQFASLGVSMSATPNGLTVQDDVFGSNPIGNRALRVEWNGSTQSVATLDFAAPISFFGAYFIDNRALVNTSIDLYNAGVFVASVSTTGETGNSAEWWGVVANAGETFTQAVFTTTASGDGFGMDNLTFSTVAVSSPAALTMLGLALVGLFFTRRS